MERAGPARRLSRGLAGLAGAGQARPSGRLAFCTRKDVYAKDDALLPSGLLGPVQLRVAVPVELK